MLTLPSFTKLSMAHVLRKSLLSPNNRLNAYMMKYPKQTSVGATCFKTVAADIMVQMYIDGKSLKEIDKSRAAVFGTFGFAYLGIFQFWLYNKAYFRWFPGVSMKSTLQKVAFDQFIKHPVLYWPTFYFLQATINERTINRQTILSVIETYESNIVKDMKALWSVWIPAQMITFGIMPTHLRLPFIATVSFFWCCGLSFIHGKYEKNQDSNDILVKETNELMAEL